MSTVTVVVSALNETADLEATLALLVAGAKVPDELIVVDDGSREPLAPRCAHAARYCPLRVVRHEARTGSGPAKHAGAALATGDTVVVMDSHMRMPWDGLARIEAAVALWPDSVLCPQSLGFESTPIGGAGIFHGRGARFIAHQFGYWECVWNERVPANAPNGTVIGCVLGGCYALGRPLLERLGGYAPGYQGWGAEEEFLSVRAWIAGGDCRLLDFAVPHQYKRKVDRVDAAASVIPEWELWANRHLWMASVWDSLRYEYIYRPLMREHYWPPGLAERIEGSAATIANLRATVAGFRKRSDEEIGFRLGIPHAPTPELYRCFWEANGKRN